MLTLQVNSRTFPVTIAPMEWMTGDHWATHPMIYISPEVSKELDRMYNPEEDEFGFGVAEYITYAMVEGWVSADAFDDDDGRPILTWAIHWNGKPISRDDLQHLMEDLWCNQVTK